jgi:copper(I)-binding protein
VSLNEEASAVIRASSRKTAAGRLLFCGGVLALLIPAVAGCEAGSDAPTLQYHSASSGAHTVRDDIAITNVFVLGAPAGSTLPSGSSASLFLSLYNGGRNSDKLESVTAPGTAASISLPGGSVALPAGTSPVNLTGPQPEVLLNGLQKTLTGGSNITLFLQFQHAGQVKLVVPVMAQSFYFKTYSPAPATPAAPGSASASPSSS